MDAGELYTADTISGVAAIVIGCAGVERSGQHRRGRAPGFTLMLELIGVDCINAGGAFAACIAVREFRMSGYGQGNSGLFSGLRHSDAIIAESPPSSVAQANQAGATMRSPSLLRPPARRPSDLRVVRRWPMRLWFPAPHPIG